MRPNIKIRLPRRLLALVALAALANLESNVEAQGVKGGSSSFGSNFINQQQQQQQQQQQIPVSNNQLSETFVQMFNTLTPVQQRQFINQMSSSNRKVFQQAIQPSTSSFFNEEVSSSSASGAPSGGLSISSVNNFNTAGTKSIKGSSQQQFLSPAQQATFFSKQQRVQSNLVQPTVQPSSSFSFSRQVTQSEQQPIIVPQTQSNEFQTQRVVQQLVQPQPQPQPQQQQQQSFFNQVQRVQQVAQPVVLPSTEQSFRRVQSFSSKPLVVPQSEVSSGFANQQIVQQIQPQTTKGTSSSFNRQIQISQPVITGTGFSSLSSSSNLAGGSGFDSASLSGFGASGALQQEKLDIGAISGQTLGGNSFENQQQQFVQSTSGGFVPVTGGASSLESSQVSSGFDSSDAQQKNLLTGGRADDLYGGLTAASINNRWYIMKPVERPSELGLGDARAASGTLRQVPLSRVLAASNRSALGGQSTASRSNSSNAENTATTTQATAATSLPKKRATEEEKKKKETELAADSSSPLEPDSASEATDDSLRRRRKR